jgi:hypothetical protein
MPRIDFQELPDHGRLWVFPASRELADDEGVVLLRAVDAFLAGWAAHGVPLNSAREVVEGRFLLVGVDVDVEAPSGCSIDALVGRLRELGSELGVTLIDHAPVWFREDARVRCVGRAEFRTMAAEGKVGPSTRVFDTSLTSVRQARNGDLEREASRSWHGRAFFRAQLAG